MRMRPHSNFLEVSVGSRGGGDDVFRERKIWRRRVKGLVPVEYSLVFSSPLCGECTREGCMMHLNKRLCECIGASILKLSGAV